MVMEFLNFYFTRLNKSLVLKLKNNKTIYTQAAW